MYTLCHSLSGKGNACLPKSSAHVRERKKISFNRQQVQLNIHIFNSQPRKEAKGKAFTELISNKKYRCQG
jgi:hypothetical protein